MNNLKDFHHYKGEDLTRFEKVERKVIELILSSNIPNNEREDSKVFEFMHASGCIQIARILCQKRNLDEKYITDFIKVKRFLRSM